MSISHLNDQGCVISEIGYPSTQNTKELTSDAPIENKRYSRWHFILKNGETISALFSDSEIEVLKKQYPEVEWSK